MKFKKLIPITLLLSLLNNCGEIPINQVKDNSNTISEKSSLNNETKEKVLVNNEIKEKADINIQNKDSNNKKQENIEKNNELVNNIKSIEENQNTETQSTEVYDPPPPIPENIEIHEFEKSKPVIVDPRFDINREVPENLTEGHISLIFKDEYKVRYYGNNILVSKTGYDLCYVNSILKKANIVLFLGSESTGTNLSLVESEDAIEKKFLEQEEMMQKGQINEVPNFLSIYYIEVVNTDIKKLIEDLRKDEVFLSVNYSGDGSSRSD